MHNFKGYIMQSNHFYNYIYLDPRKPGQYIFEDLNFSLLYEPIYVGKGKLNKDNKHWNYRKYYHLTDRCLTFDSNKLKVNKIKHIMVDFNMKQYILQINKEITYEQSNDIEISLIKTFGRINLRSGTLTNLTDGGEGLKNVIHSDQTKSKISNSLKRLYSTNYVHPMKNKKHSSDTIKKFKSIDMCDKRYDSCKTRNQSNIKNPFYNKTHTDDYKTHLKNINTGFNNPIFWKYIFISPSNVKFEVIGKWRTFCKEHSLNERKIKQVFTLKLKDYEGWVVTLNKECLV